MKIYRYFIINGFFVFCLYMGFVKNVTEAQYIAYAYAWYCICISWILFFINKKELLIDAGKKWTEAQKTLRIPSWFDQLFDLTVVAFMCSHNLWVTGALYLVHMMIVLKFKEDAVKAYQTSLVPENVEAEDKKEFKF